MDLTEWARAGHPCEDCLPLVPGGSAAGSGAEGRTTDPGVSRDGRRVCAGRGTGCTRGCPPMTRSPTWIGRSPGCRWAVQAGMSAVRVEAEVGSGMSGARAGARRLLADQAAAVIVVEQRDRLRRVNTELVEAALSAHGRRLVVLDDSEVMMPGAGHGRGADVVLRRAVRAPVGAEPGVEGRWVRPAGYRPAGGADGGKRPARRCRVSGLRGARGRVRGGATAGARVRTRLRVSGQDEAVLWAVGAHLGSLAGRDLAARCAEGRLDAKGRAVSRRGAEAGADRGVVLPVGGGDHPHQRGPGYRLAGRNLRAERASLQARIRRIEARLAGPGRREGRPGCAGTRPRPERHAKTVRLQALKARLARVDRQLEAGAVPVVRGGKALLAQAGQPRRCGADRGAVAGGSGSRPACS